MDKLTIDVNASRINNIKFKNNLFQCKNIILKTINTN